MNNGLEHIILVWCIHFSKKEGCLIFMLELLAKLDD